jgi:RNA polymerase sigma-70 factor (ECF subfamily)
MGMLASAMMDTVLAGIFLAETHQISLSADAPAGVTPSDVVPGNLEAMMVRLTARGRAGFPGLQVDDADFVRVLARSAFKAKLAAQDLDQLAIEDLYLVCACLVGAPGAVTALDRRCCAPLRAAISRLVREPAQVEEVEQQVRDLLFVGNGQVPPKLTSYAGRGALGKWVGVVAQRLALMMIRADKAEARMRDAAAADALHAQVDPELAFVKDRYRGVFRAALEQALAALTARERMVMRLNLVTGMTVDGIAKIYGVHQSTVSRWLAKAREAVLATAQQSLRVQVGISPDEMESLAVLMASQLDLSVSRILRRA